MPAVHPGEGPVAVTGASGYIGSHTVIALMRRGFEVRGCVTDISNPDKTDHLLALNDNADLPGRVDLFQANLLTPGSYDDIVAGCSAVLHVGTPMGYAGANKPQEVYDGALAGTKNVLSATEKTDTVKRFVYTSSFAAIGHPAPSGYRFTEADWASDNREDDKNWSLEDLDEKGEVGYAMAKVELEHLVADTAAANRSFEAVSICPIVVLGPLLSTAHELVGSWQWHMGRMLAGKTCRRGWQHLWNIVDVRDVGEAHALCTVSEDLKNGDRFQLSATDTSGEIDVPTLQRHLSELFPEIDVAGPPEEIEAMLEKHGQVFQAPLAHCDKARSVLGLETHDVMDTLHETGQTMIDLKLVTQRLKA